MFADNQNFYTTGSDGRVYQWDISKPSDQGKLLFRNFNIVNEKIALSDDNGLLICANKSPFISIFDLNASEGGLTQIQTPMSATYDATFIPGTRDFLITGSDSTIYRYQNSEIKPVIKLRSKAFKIELLADGQHLLVGSESGKVFLYRISDASLISEFNASTNAIISAIASNADMSKISFGDNEGLVRIIDLNPQFEQVRETDLRGHDDKIVSDLTFNESLGQLISASTDGSVRVWDLAETDNFPIVIDDHDAWVLSIALSPDGKSLYVGCRDKVFRRYPMTVETMSEELIPKISRSITPIEWSRYIGDDIGYTTIVDKSQ